MKNMRNPPSAEPTAEKSVPAVKTYHCGDLTYTKAGLFILVAWMLWGDFCYTIMEAVVPSIIPLKLKSLGCSNWQMGLIMSTIPGILGMTLCPYISFKSDRFRSRWGRRIPFILLTMPFLCLSLIFIGWSEDISTCIRANIGFLSAYSQTAVTLTLIAAFLVMFHFFNDFVGSVFNYLFNDVVPSQFLSRFMGLFRMTGTIAGAFYNYFVFRYAESHMREIFTASAVLYLLGFGIVCLKVKERKYPPLDDEEKRNSRGIAAVKTYFQESFAHKFYWFIFIGNAFAAIAASIHPFTVFFQREMGLSLDHIGKLSAVISISVLAAMYFAAVFIDRWHPVRITAYAATFNIISIVMYWVWIFVSLPGELYFWLCLGTSMTSAFYSALTVVAGIPRQMRLFPQSRYGQFCSAQAMLKWLCVIVGGVCAGLYIDLVRSFCPTPDFAYRFYFLWVLFFMSLSVATGLYVYYQWLHMGGDRHYHPPAPWNPMKVEEMPVVPTIGPLTRWLNLSFILFDSIMAVSVMIIPPMMWMLYQKGLFFDFKCFGLMILPLSIAAWLYWNKVKKGIRADMIRARANEPLINGIPHHGMLLIVAIKYVLVLAVWIAQVFVCARIQLENAAMIFGVANVLTNFMLVGIIYSFSIIERGCSVKIDEEIIWGKDMHSPGEP